MIGETKRGDENEGKGKNNKETKILDELEFMTEEGYYVKINLNSSKKTILFMACKEQIGETFYSKEFTLKDIYKIVSSFRDQKKKIEDIFEILITSINANKVDEYKDMTKKSEDKEFDKLVLQIDLILYNNDKLVHKKQKFELNKITLSKEEIKNILIDKVNLLIKEKNYYLEGCKRKKLIDKNKEEKITTRINSLEKNIDLLEKKLKVYIDTNLLSCSNIVNTLEDWKVITEKLKEINPKYNNILFNLVYRATRDGDSSEEFHKKCDEIGENITLVKTLNNHRFGGFTKNNWKHMEQDINPENKDIGSIKEDIDAFCFSIDLNKIYPNSVIDKGVIFCCNNYGPTFCRNIFAINNKMLELGGYCMKKSCSCFSGQDIDYEISGGKKVFGIKELEVLEIIFI